eukprot:5943572-Alexandrium_andersonii.AAC.1
MRQRVRGVRSDRNGACQASKRSHWPLSNRFWGGSAAGLHWCNRALPCAPGQAPSALARCSG